MSQARILHLLPRCTGAGPERSLLASIACAPASAPDLRHTVVVLDTPVSASMYLAARRLGVDMLVRPDDAELRQLAAASDVVVVHFWNHPLLLATLGRVDLGETRVVVWSMVLGLHRPQVLPAEVGRFADVLVVTTERSLDSDAAQVAGAVRTVPGIADMSRLDAWRPRSHDGVHVGYLGVVSPAKMHPRFAELCALVRNPSVHFVVVGSGGGEEQLSRRALDLGIRHRLTCTGYVDDIASALGTFDVFGYPLCSDTYATSEKALQEAMWVGIPPVVFPHGGLADLVDDGETGLVVDTDEGYAAAIDRLAGDASLRSRIGDAAQHAARRRFDPWALAAAWRDVVVMALDMPRRQRSLLHDGCTGADLFVAAQGDRAGPFARSLIAIRDGAASSSSDEEIARSSPLVVGGDGGLVHFYKTWPDDTVLRRWVRLAGADRRAVDGSS